MARKAPQIPSVAYFEEYDDTTGDVVNGTRQSANITVKRSKSELRPLELVNPDFASDSGYSSRTTTTGTSAQSRASGRPIPGSLVLNTAVNSRTIEIPPPTQHIHRVKESRKEKGKQREDRRITSDMLHMEHLRNASGMAPPVGSPAKSKRRESMSLQHQQEPCWECLHGLHHANGMHSSTPMDPRSATGYPSYYYSQSPAVQSIPPASPQSAQFPYGYSPDVMVAQSRQRRPSRAATYHSEDRPLSYHSAMQEPMYNPGALTMNHYDQRPSSVYSGYYTQSQTPRQQYYAEPDVPYQAIYERSRTSSMSRPRDRDRRASVYGRTVVDHVTPKASYEDGSYIERHVSKEHRPRRMSQSQPQRRPETFDADEDYYRMPPPPLPQPKPKIIQKRPDLTHKPVTTGSMPPPTNRRMSHSRDSWDMSELKQALPHQQIRKISAAPERSRSMKARRTSYHESDSGRQIAVEDSRRRRTLYHEEEESSIRPVSDLEQKHRNAEEYQASKSGRNGLPLTEDALRMKAKIAQRVDSDSGSQKTRSNSSRGSDARTNNGSGVGSRIDDDGGFTMTMNGMTIGFTQESVNGKRIHLRTNDNGAIGLNIEGRRPKRYIMPPGSDYTSTSTSSRKEIEDGRRAREDRRSDRASRRSSRSTYSARFD